MKKVTVITKGMPLPLETIVTLVKDPMNARDADAIRIDLDGEAIGFLANTPSTVAEGTISASMLKEDFKDSAKAQIKEFLRIQSEVYRYYSAELIKDEKVGELEFTLVGGTTIFPGKKELIKAVAANNHALVKLELEGDRVVGIYESAPAGSVKADEETFDSLRRYVEDFSDVLATVNSMDKGQFSCHVVVGSSVREAKSKRVSLEAVLEKILKDGMDAQESLTAKLEYLRKYNVPEVAIQRLFESYVKYPEQVSKRIPAKPVDLYIDTASIVSDAIAFMNVGDNLMFEGDKGVGKNVLTVTLAWLYARPLYEFSSNSQHSNSALLGGKTFEAKSITEEESRKNLGQFIGLTKLLRKVFVRGEKVDVEEPSFEDARLALMKFLGQKDQKLVFEMSSIVEAMLYGGILVLDEVNTSVSHVLSLFNSALDDRRRMEITGFGQVNAHQNFIAIGTMNLNYEGTFEMNEATRDRFVNIPFPPLTSISPIIQAKFPGLNYESIAQANRVYLGLRNAVNAGTLSEQALTIRGFISACKVLSQGISLKDALIKGVANKVDDKDERKAIVEIIELQIN